MAAGDGGGGESADHDRRRCPQCDQRQARLLIGREGREGDDSGGVTTGDDGCAYAEAGEYAHDFLEVALGQPLGGAFREVEDNDDDDKDDGDE